MKAIIHPSKLAGGISAPPSKSYTHRAIIFVSLAIEKSFIHNPLISEDTSHTIAACQALGVKIQIKDKTLEITGLDGRFPNFNRTLKLFCGLSGTTIRLMTGVAALSPNEIILEGEKRLNERPIGDLISSLKSQGIDILSANTQFPPIKIKGGMLRGGKIKISGKTSSQFVSALLIIAPFAHKDTEIIVESLHSSPYVDITIDLMETFGVNVEKSDGLFIIKSHQRYKAKNYIVEGDFSSASYFIAANKITRSNISLDNLNPDSVQGDKIFMDILKKFKNKNNTFDLGNYPDIVPSVTIVATVHDGKTTITNIGHLRLKESDRIKALVQE